MTKALLAQLEPVVPLESGVLWAQLEALGSPARAETKALLGLLARRDPRGNAALPAPLARMASQGPWDFRALPELPGLLARKGTRGKWDPLATREAEERRAKRAPLDQQGFEVLWGIRVPREQMGPRGVGDPQASLGRKEMMASEALWGSLAPLAYRGCRGLLERKGRLEMWAPWVPMERQVLGVLMVPAEQRAPQGCLEELVSLEPWVRRVSLGLLEIQGPQEPQGSRGPREMLVKRETQAPLELLDHLARRALLARTGPKETWAP